MSKSSMNEEDMDLFKLAVWALFGIQIVFALSAILATSDYVDGINQLAETDPANYTEIPGSFVFASVLGYLGISIVSFILARRMIDENTSTISRVFCFAYFIIIFVMLYAAANDPSNLAGLLLDTGA